MFFFRSKYQSISKVRSDESTKKKKKRNNFYPKIKI